MKVAISFVTAHFLNKIIVAMRWHGNEQKDKRQA